MAGWTETYRGAVPPWQCDVTEHFTIAYYFDRFEETAANLADELDLGDLLRSGAVPRQLNVRFVSELRAGSCFHVESAALGTDSGLDLGHRFVDSATGETVTWFHDHWNLSATPLTPQQSRIIAGRLVAWEGPELEARPEPSTTAGFIPTARGRVKAGDLDATGCFALGAIVHRFSNASGQTGTAIGFDAAFMEQHRRGFSTFELTMRLSGSLRLDEPYLVETGVAHLGNSSLRMIHRMTNQRTGAEVAQLGQFGVSLDLDARRPVRWAGEIRARAEALVVPTG